MTWLLRFANDVWIDILGGDVSTDAKYKKTFNRNEIIATALATGVCLNFGPYGLIAALIFGGICLWKIKLYYTNTF